MARRASIFLGRAALAVALLSLWACEGAKPDLAPAAEPSEAQVPTAPSAPVAKPASLDPAMPRMSGAFGPSFARMKAGETPTTTVINEVETCSACHSQVVQEWKESVHAFSAFNNPFYRVSLEDFTQARDPKMAKFCNGCHDIAVVFDETPELVAAHQKEGFSGVTCATCHGATEVFRAGNGSYVLTTEPIPLPTPGDEASLKAHRARVGGAATKTNDLCISCHRGFMSDETGHGALIRGVDEWGPWRRSAYRGSHASRIDEPVEEASCISCHMSFDVEGAQGPHRSHRFPGGHTAISALVGGKEQLRAQQVLLEGEASLDVRPLRLTGAGGVPVSEAEAVVPGQDLVFDVVIRNESVGHLFPGGARDMRDTFLTLELKDAQGRALARSGFDHAQGKDEPGAYRMRTVVLDEQGKAVFEHKVADFRTAVIDRTLEPRDAGVARFAWAVPKELAAESLPLSVEVKLHNRRIQPAHHARTCAESKTERGKAFRDATKRWNGVDVDPCEPQPVLEVAQAQTWLGAGAQAKLDARLGTPLWKRLWVHGLALSKQIQENQDEAKRAFEGAREALASDAPPWARASITLELAKVAGRQGRTDDAMALCDEAERLMPGHPAIPLARGEALSNVWRWEPAASAFRLATERAPNDDRGWRGLAIALGSLGRRGESLDAARAGLKQEPRDHNLLLSQSLALDKLAPEDPRAKQAKEVWLRYRRDDLASAIQGKCVDPSSEDCQKARLGVYVTRLDKGGGSL
jgi:hypothetical protein